MSKPVIASYCSTFLKPEMLHIYRQVTGLREFQTFVICKERLSEERYPFADIEIAPEVRSNFIRRFWLKYVKQEPPIVYRGEYGVLNAILERRQADLMHVYFGHTGVHLLPFLRRWPKPAVVSFHGMDVQPREDRPGYLNTLKELLKEMPVVMARSESLRHRLVELGCDPKNVRLNRTSIPMELYPARARPVPADGGWRLIQACRLVEKKGLDLTLRAFAALRAEFPQSTLTLAGDGPLREELEKQAGELNLGDSVTFTGFLSVEELAGLFAQSHIFIHPSRLTADLNQEGVPNAMVEAMATGLPVVATLHGGIPEAVTHGKSGLLAPENDWKALRDFLFELVRDPAKWQAMGQAAAEEAREKFALETQIANLEAIYREVMATGKI